MVLLLTSAEALSLALRMEVEMEMLRMVEGQLGMGDLLFNLVVQLIDFGCLESILGVGTVLCECALEMGWVDGMLHGWEG